MTREIIISNVFYLYSKQKKGADNVKNNSSRSYEESVKQRLVPIIICRFDLL